MNSTERRLILFGAVVDLEPHANCRAIQDYVRARQGRELSLLRIYVDLERLVGDGALWREKRTSPDQDRMSFHYEATGKVNVEPAWDPLRYDMAKATPEPVLAA